jgi:phage terminase large subunit-like protein
LHRAQWEIIQHPARFKVAACGRRFGKTLAACGECVRRAIQGQQVWWVAPTFPISLYGWRGITRLASQVPGITIRRWLRMVEFPGGGFVQIKSADNPDALRGEGLDFVVVDEAAFIAEEAWTEALRPALADRQGGALFVSTPNGRNWFWHVWMRGQDPAQPDWKAFQFPTSANPYIAPAEIEEARALLPERVFRQEFLAEFLEDGGAVFRNLTACATGAPQEAPVPGHRYVFGVDWGRADDFTAIAILDVEERRLVALDRFNRIGWALQRGRLAELARRWQPVRILAEANSIGGPNIEALQAEGLPVQGFMTTAPSKGPLIDALALAFEQGAVTIYPDQVLMSELQAYTLERMPSGSYRYSAPPGMHDDTVIALALAWHCAAYSGAGIAFI